MNLFDLAAKLTLDSSEYEKGLDDAEKKGSGFGGKLKSAMKIGAAAVTAVTGATVAMGGAIVKSTGEVAAHGDEIDKMSQKMGISAQAYQEWDAILQHSGSSIDAMSKGMITLQKKAADNADAFEQLGITQEDLANMSTEDLFAATISGLQNMEEGAKRTALASDLFGGSAKELGPLLNQTAEDTEAMRQKVHELGGVMSDDAVKAAAAYQDSLQDMKTAFGGLKKKMVGDFLPGVKKVMDGLTALFSGGGTEQINEGIQEIINKISEKMPEFLKLGGDIVMSITSAILTNLPALVTAAGDLLMSFGTGIVEQLPLLVTVAFQILETLSNGIIESLPELIPVAIDAILQLVDTMTENVDMLVDAAIAITMALANGLIAALPTLIAKAPEIVAKLVDAIVRNAPKLLSAAGQIIKSLVQGIAAQFGQIVNSGQQIINKILTGIGQLMSQLFTKGAELVKKVISGATSVISSVAEIGGQIVKGVWQGISDGFTWIKNKIKEWVGNVFSFIKRLFGIASPSKLFRDEIGKNLARGIGLGFVDEMKNVERMMEGAIPETDSLFNSTVSVSSSRGTIDGEILALLRDIRANMGYDIVLSDGTLAGRMDKLLGQRAMQRARGNA